jgi:hypothetical protein
MVSELWRSTFLACPTAGDIASSSIMQAILEEARFDPTSILEQLAEVTVVSDLQTIGGPFPYRQPVRRCRSTGGDPEKASGFPLPIDPN